MANTKVAKSMTSTQSTKSTLSSQRVLRDLNVYFVTFVLTPGFYCGSTSTVTFTSLACVLQPEAVYCN